MRKFGLLLLATLFILGGCGTNNNEMAKKSVIVYYSQTGTTQQVAQAFANFLNIDMIAIDVEQPYDGTYDETIARCIKERETGELPVLSAVDIDLAQYDTIYLGYPVWFGTCARPMLTFLKDFDLSGKTIIPFCTFGSGGTESSAQDIITAQPNATVAEGYGVRTARVAKAQAEVEYFLKSKGYIEGEVEVFPEYSEQQPVTADEVTIFNTACSDYQYPLGTPLTVGQRTTANSTDYKFIVDSGATIYVTVDNNDEAKAEFTKVVR